MMKSNLNLYILRVDRELTGYFPELIRNRIFFYIELRIKKAIRLLEDIWIIYKKDPIKLRRFNIDKILNREGNTVVVIGKPAVGKGILLRDIIYQLDRQVLTKVVVHPSEEYSRTYQGVIQPLFIHDQYSSQLVENFITRQKQLLRNAQQGISTTNRNNRGLIVLDDCMYDNRNWTNDRGINDLFMNGRNYKSDLFMTMQYPMGIPKNLRCNIDYIFIGKETNVSTQRKLWEQYGGVFSSFALFSATFDHIKNYSFLVIDNTTDSNKLKDQVFWYQATIRN